MNKKRNYPLFMIDRSKPAAYPFDYIVCHDKTVGFVARVVFFPKTEQFREYIRQVEQVPDGNSIQISTTFKTGGLIIVIEDFFYFFEMTNENRKRIETLLKKALKKYLHAELVRMPFDDLGIENQIKQQQLTLERAEQNYSELVSRANGSTENADYIINLARATLDTLKQARDNEKFYKLYMN